MRTVFFTGIVATVTLCTASFRSPQTDCEATELDTEKLERIVGGTVYYCRDSSPGPDSTCADCAQQESGTWVRCSSENQQLTKCDMPFVGPPPSPACEEDSDDCGGTVWEYPTEFDCQNDFDHYETNFPCSRTFIETSRTFQAQVNCP